VYEQIKGKLDIKYWDSKDKFKAMDRAKVVVALWSGMVPIESMMVGTPVVSYDTDYMKELFGETLLYGPNNNTDYLATNIDYCLKMNDNSRYEICDSFKKAMEKKEINTYTQDEAVKLLEKLILKAVQVKEQNDSNRARDKA
jgi:glycosyltransferase involved in cell wall biosynthesis